MPTLYPAAIDDNTSLPSVTNLTAQLDIHPALENSQSGAIKAIETILGANGVNLLVNPMTVRGDIIYLNGALNMARRAVGADAHQHLGRTAATPEPNWIPDISWNASAFGVTADSVTNDTAAWVAAITAAFNGGGGWVDIDGGGSIVDVGNIVLPAKCGLRLGGATLIFNSTTGIGVEVASDWCRIEGGFITNLATQVSGCAIQYTSGQGFSMRDTVITGNWYDGLKVVDGYEGNFDNISYYGWVNAGVYHQGVVNPDQGDNAFSNSTWNVGTGTAFYWTSGAGVRYTNNKIVGASATGVDIVIVDGATCSGFYMGGINSIENQTAYGIRVREAGTTGILYQLMIQNVQMANIGAAGVGVGISLDSHDGISLAVVQNNSISGGTGATGIQVGANVSQCTLSGNTLSNFTTGIIWSRASSIGLGVNFFESCTTNQTGGVLAFNDGLNDVDTRIAGDTIANLFYVDAGLDYVGIGAVPVHPFDVTRAGTSAFGTRFQQTVTSVANNAALVAIIGTLAGGTGTLQSGLRIEPIIAPTAAVATIMGVRIGPTFTPAVGVVITNATPVRIVLTTGADAGGGAAIGTGYGLYISASYSLKPTNAYGINIENMGSASMTLSTALRIGAQSGSTTNYGVACAAVLNGFGTDTPTETLDVNADTIRIRTAKTPATSGATGTVGQIAWDADYFYVCTATNTWERTAHAVW